MGPEPIQSIELRTEKWFLRGGFSAQSHLWEGFLMDREDYSVVETFQEATLKGMVQKMEEVAEGKIDLRLLVVEPAK